MVRGSSKNLTKPQEDIIHCIKQLINLLQYIIMLLKKRLLLVITIFRNYHFGVSGRKNNNAKKTINIVWHESDLYRRFVWVVYCFSNSCFMSFFSECYHRQKIYTIFKCHCIHATTTTTTTTNITTTTSIYNKKVQYVG